MGEVDVLDLITVRRAMEIIDSVAVRPFVTRVSLGECAGLCLAGDLLSDRDGPAFDKSLMDGYAVRARDVGEVPCELLIVGRVAAGEVAAGSLAEGTAMAIMTGAPMPRGADAVVPIEFTELIGGSGRVRICQSVLAGKFVGRRGSDVAGGTVVLKTGMRLGAAQIAVAASIGAVEVPVFAAPSVGVLGTGDELVFPNQIPVGAQIRSCNNPMLMTLLGKYRCRASDLGLAPDDPGVIRKQIELGLKSDCLLISGGMSMGERDFVPGILRELGGELLITKLRIKPGKPFIFARMPGGKFAFGLPGNPVSAFVCTVCLVWRLLARIAGGAVDTGLRSAPLARGLGANGSRTFYQPAKFDGRALTPLEWKGSADVFTLSEANALLVREENQGPEAVGAAVEFIEL